MIRFWWEKIKSEPLLGLWLGYLALSQLYYSYRYILGYNSTFTSPTSKDTPIQLQAGKYVLTAIFYVLLLAVILLRRERYREVLKTNLRRHRRSLVVVMIGLAYLILSLAKFNFNLTNFSYSQLIKELFFVPMALVPFLLTIDRSFLKAVFKLLAATVVFQILGFLVVYILFVTTGKLPALASANDLIRFGGLWDDPNAAAMYLSIPLVALLSLSDGLQRRYQGVILLTVAVVAAIIYLTLSLTLWIALAIGLVGLVIIKRDRFATAGAVTVVGVFFILNLVSPYSKNFVEYKVSSLGERVCSTITVKNQASCLTWFKDHFRSGNLFREFSSEEGAAPPLEAPPGSAYSTNPTVNTILTATLGRRGTPTFSEDIYISTFFNFGLLGILALLAIIFVSMRRAISLIRRPDETYRALGIFSLITLIIFSVGNLGLPYLAIYPVGLYIWLVVVLTQLYPEKSK